MLTREQINQAIPILRKLRSESFCNEDVLVALAPYLQFEIPVNEKCECKYDWSDGSAYCQNCGLISRVPWIE